MDVREKVNTFPQDPGVYIMHSANGKVIYVGKAKSLKKRVSQYFLPGRDVKTRALVSHINDIEYIITGSEYEALILENNLIKKYKPRYNIDLKDDKTYQMIKITHEKYPRIMKTRRKSDDKAEYFGPFPKGADLDLFYKLIESTFCFRRCSHIENQKSLCIYYHIGKCPGVCVKDIPEADYRGDINKIIGLLKGNTNWIEEKLEKSIRAHSQQLEFELAQKDAQTLNAVRKISSLQSVGNQDAKHSKDYIGLYKNESFYSIEIMQYRNGNLLGNACYRRESFSNEDEILASFIMQYYSTIDELPDEIYLSFEIDKELVEKYLSNVFKDVKIQYPSSGRDFRIAELAYHNAKDNLLKYLKKKQDRDRERNVGVQSSSQMQASLKILTSIPNLGEVKAMKILSEYPSINQLLNDSVANIQKRCAISYELAEKIISVLKIEGK